MIGFLVGVLIAGVMFGATAFLTWWLADGYGVLNVAVRSYSRSGSVSVVSASERPHEPFTVGYDLYSPSQDRWIIGGA